MKATPITILWDYISSENGLKQWFADGVKIKDREYIFTWKGYSQEARLVGMRKGLAIKLQWLDSSEKVYFGFLFTAENVFKLVGNVLAIVFSVMIGRMIMSLALIRPVPPRLLQLPSL